jgi:alpha-tubulin suppressor-like RCC1 family protein
MKRIREQEAAEKKRREKWSKELKQTMNSNNYTPIFNSTNTYNPSGQWTIGDITIADHTTNTTLKVDGTLEVKGRDVLKELDEMRDALLLLKRDVDMESKYPKLKELKDEYERALEKYKTFEALK